MNRLELFNEVIAKAVFEGNFLCIYLLWNQDNFFVLNINALNRPDSFWEVECDPASKWLSCCLLYTSDAADD